MSDTSLRFNFLTGRDTASPHMARIAASATAMSRTVGTSGRRMDMAFQRNGREVFKIDNTFRNTFRRMASVVALWGGIIVAAIGHAVAFTYAIWPMIGALAAIPAVAVGAAVGLLPLIGIFNGLLASMKKTGGGASNTADQIAAAEHRIEQAQRSAVDAQKALNDAREEAADRLRDIAVQLARANLDQKEAALAVREAEIALRQARASGDVNERRRAELALESARLSQIEVANRLSDVQQEFDDRQAKGVEGSDEVVNATQRQADALYELAQAQQELMKARSGGGASAQAAAYAKLSAAGKALVDTLRALAPAWRTLQQQIQQAALVGVAEDVSRLSAALLAQRAHLVSIGAAWNTAFRNILQLLSSPAGHLDIILGNSALMAQKLAAAWRPFLAGFLNFVAASSNFMPRFGQWVLDLAIRFERWANSVRDSGRLQAWIENAVVAARQFAHWLGAVSSAIGLIFRAGSGGPNYLANLATSAQQFRDALAAPENQAQLAKFFEVARNLGSQIWSVFKDILKLLVDLAPSLRTLVGVFTIIGSVVRYFADHVDFLNRILPPLIQLFIAVKIATMAWTVAQIALDAAMDANPLGLIVLAIEAVIAAMILLVMNWDTIRSWLRDHWKDILIYFTGPIGLAVLYIKDHWNDIITFIKGLPGRIANAAVGMWDGLVAAFKSAINWIIRLWNDFHLTLGGGSILGYNIPSITLNTPDIPYLAKGGSATSAGAAIVGEAGPELIFMPQGATVAPLPGAPSTTTLVVQSGGSKMDDFIVEMIRRYVRVQGGGNVQTAFGR